MADFLKVIGIIVFVLAGAVGALTFSGGGFVAVFAVLPALVGAAAVYGLGEIMANLREIRLNSARQTAALERMADAGKPAAPLLYEPVLDDRPLGLRRERKLD